MPPYVPPHDDFQRRHGAYLPHWTQASATYFLTFRLHDALPGSVLAQYAREREELLIAANHNGSESQIRLIESHYRRKLHGYLDRGHGDAFMKDPANAAVVADAITFFDGDRYDLWAWCVMANHVHVIVQPKKDHTLSDIQKSWKGFTGREINKRLHRQGPVWQPEGWDHLVRSYAYLRKYVKYIELNPRDAGLPNWRWMWISAALR